MPRTKTNLSTLPIRYQKFGRHWKDTLTGSIIHSDNIHKYLPTPPAMALEKHEQIMAKRWDLR